MDYHDRTWKDRDMVFMNINGAKVIDVVCYNVDPTYCIDQFQLRFDDIGVVIMCFFNNAEIDETWRVLYNGISLHDDNHQFNEIQSEKLANLHPKK